VDFGPLSLVPLRLPSRPLPLPLPLPLPPPLPLPSLYLHSWRYSWPGMLLLGPLRWMRRLRLLPRRTHWSPDRYPTNSVWPPGHSV
jgi:hypothetical protein